MSRQIHVLFYGIIASFLIALAQLFFKIGAEQLPTLLTNVHLLVGIIFYGLGGSTLILALRKQSVSLVYPTLALSFVWATIFSFTFLSEQISLFRYVGVFSIVIGVCCLARGAR